MIGNPYYYAVQVVDDRKSQVRWRWGKREGDFAILLK